MTNGEMNNDYCKYYQEYKYFTQNFHTTLLTVQLLFCGPQNITVGC